MNRVTAFLFMLAVYLLAIADNPQKYREYADTIRNEVWNMDLPSFKSPASAEKYSDESAVILAAYRCISAKKKTGIAFNVAMLTNILTSPIKTTPQIHATDLYRRLIQINDRAALEKFSEFELVTREKTSNALNFWAYYKEDVNYVLGVRIIKPDGKIIVVDTNDFIDVKEGKNEKKLKQKLAVPGLEIGDKIDVFYYTESKLKNAHLDLISIYFRDEYPILNYRVHCEFDDDLTSQIRTTEGAPEFVCSQAENKDYIIDAELTEPMEKIPNMWYNGLRQSPATFIAVYNRRNKQDYTPKSAKKDGIQINPDPLAIQNDSWERMDGVAYSQSFFGTLTGHLEGGKKVAGNLKKMLKNGEITKQQAADYLYNLLAFSYSTNSYRYFPNDFVYYYRWFLDLIGIKDAEMAISSVDSDQPIDQGIYYDNILWLAHIKDIDRWYFPITGFTAPGEVPAGYQGNPAALRPPKKKKDQDSTQLQFIMPVSSPVDNRSISSLYVSVDGTSLDIDRNEENYGSRKNIAAADILTEQDLVDGYLRYLNRYGQTIALKENKKKAAEREERYRDAREEQLSAMKEEAKSYHGIDALQLKDYKIRSIGIDPDSAMFSYNLRYTIDGFVKRAGRNMVVSIGLLMSPQAEVLPSDRERTDDVYMISPRQFETDIILTIPAGYKVSAKSLDALNNRIENEAGAFTSQARTDGDKLLISTLKRYNHKIETAKNWHALTQVLDAAADWRTHTLLLEKQ